MMLTRDDGSASDARTFKPGLRPIGQASRLSHVSIVNSVPREHRELLTLCVT